MMAPEWDYYPQKMRRHFFWHHLNFCGRTDGVMLFLLEVRQVFLDWHRIGVTSVSIMYSSFPDATRVSSWSQIKETKLILEKRINWRPDKLVISCQQPPLSPTFYCSWQKSLHLMLKHLNAIGFSSAAYIYGTILGWNTQKNWLR